MDIKSFRIKNYRSIKDSGDCYLSGDNITIIAGKNESGKTAILEALEDFNTARDIRNESIPLSQTDSKPEISVTFSLDKETFAAVAKKISLNATLNEPSLIVVTKTYPKVYSFDFPEGLKRKLTGTVDESKTKKARIEHLHSQIVTLHLNNSQIGGKVPDLDFGNLPITIAQFTDFERSVAANLESIPDLPQRQSLAKALKNILTELNSIEKSESMLQNFSNNVLSHMPNFILFSSFDDVFPSEIALSDAPNNELIKDLDIISDLNLGLITSGSTPIKKRHKEQLNIRLQEDYRTFWTQDLTNLSIDWDSPNLQFFVSESGHFYPPNMRSKGKQWHLSFYVRVTARAREDVPNVILIDEPGLFVHAQAQKDIIKKLEECSEKAPIIFSTHSPYLISTNKLSRIRLVLKPNENDGTVISNKIHKTADIETLTPIITAIGLDLSLGLDIAKENNIIFEGITDYYYVSAFIKILGFHFPAEIHLIPGASADKINLLISLMIGWGLNHSVILDNDQKGRRVYNELQKDFGPSNIKIQFVSQERDKDIEDLFSKEDFLKHVLNEEPQDAPAEKTNSQIIKQVGNKYDTVLLAKLFYEKATTSTISLSVETKKNFKDLLERIRKLMFNR